MYPRLLLAAGLLGLGACSRQAPADPNAPRPATELATQARELTRNFDTWYQYAYYAVPLMRQFAPRDEAGRPIGKRAFLDWLSTGRFVALQNGRAGQLPVYQLVTFRNGLPDISQECQRQAREELDNTARQGQPLPAYRFTDLAGRTYTPENTKGKVLVIKCWFLACSTCVQEFPEVNKLADAYARPDVLFVSLVHDDAQLVREFLQAKPLHYATVPGSEVYQVNKLGISSYPTHIVVGRDGRITYFSSTATYLAPAIEAAIGPGRAVAQR